MATQPIIYPPIIDDNVTAFEWEYWEDTSSINNSDSMVGSIKVCFDLQTLEGVYKDYIAAQVLINGIYNQGLPYDVYRVQLNNNISNMATDGEYYVSIPIPALLLNSILTIKLGIWSEETALQWEKDNLEIRILNRDSAHTGFIPSSAPEVWSMPVAFYPISSPTLTSYGGLTKSEVEFVYSLSEAEESKKLLKVPPMDNHVLNEGTKCYFKSTLSFGSDYSAETDTIIFFETKLFGLANKKKTNTDAPFSDEAAGYATLIEVDSSQGSIYIDYDWDSTRRNFRFSFNYDAFKEYDSYELLVTYRTRKGYVGSQTYCLFRASSSGEEDVDYDTRFQIGNLVAIPQTSKGAISLKATLSCAPDSNDKLINGLLIFERKSNMDARYQPCYQCKYQFEFSDDKNNTIVQWDDVTAESGILYNYRVRFKTQQLESIDAQYLYIQEDSSNTVSNVILFLEDIFLSTRDLSLKIRYNPELSGLKRNVVDVITPTLGGVYPFVRRNGAQIYKTFTVGGLISYNSEIYEPNKWDVNANYTPTPLYPEEDNTRLEEQQDFYNSLFVNVNSQNRIDCKIYNELVKNSVITAEDRRIIYERLFRDMVIDFLYKDHVLLFKSQAEGNMFIRLSNINFTPNKQLDRHIYSFTATATEVLEASPSNYLKYFSNSYEDGIPSVLLDIFALNEGIYAYNVSNETLYTNQMIDDPQDNTLWVAELNDDYSITDKEIGSTEIYQGTAATYGIDVWGVPIDDKSLPTVEKMQTMQDTTHESISVLDQIDILANKIILDKNREE